MKKPKRKYQLYKNNTGWSWVRVIGKVGVATSYRHYDRQGKCIEMARSDAGGLPYEIWDQGTLVEVGNVKPS